MLESSNTAFVDLEAINKELPIVCVLLPLENLLWAKLRDYAISRVNPNPRYAFFMWVVNM